MKSYQYLLCFTIIASLLSTSCQSGKTIRVDASQVTEYRDLTVRDLDEFSSKMFIKLMQSPLAKTSTGEPP
ncbi:MAG: hypothetical protein QNL65_11135, partial [Opitutales bacterium]